MDPISPKSEWIEELPSGPSDKDSLARLVDSDGGRDDAENEYYEWASAPEVDRLETTKRRYRGQFLRRLRRIEARKMRKNNTE